MGGRGVEPLLALLLLVAMPAAGAQACSPPPDGYALAPRAIPLGSGGALEIVALESATFPHAARARILTVASAPYKVGQIIRVQPQPGSICGPYRVARGTRGFFLVNGKGASGGPIPLGSFVRVWRSSGKWMWMRMRY
jgi:hypothetical protein